jgi:hypothetical protein
MLSITLDPDIILKLCHGLLRRSAAMQLAPTQPTYDNLIPFYCGEEQEEPDTSNVELL